MTSKLLINLENLLRQRQVEGERIEYKAGGNPDAVSLRQRLSVLQPRVARHALPWDTSPDTSQPQRGCAPCDARSTPADGTALRFDIPIMHSQGRPHCIRPTLGWRTESPWDRMINPTIGAGLDEKLDERLDELELAEERSYFLIRLPVHEKANDGSGLMSETGSEKTALGSEKSSEKTAPSSEKTSGDTAGKIVELIQKSPTITAGELAMALGISSRAVEKQLAKIKDSGRIQRQGSDKGGRWVVLDLASSEQQSALQTEADANTPGSEKTDHVTLQNGTKMALSRHQVEILHRCQNENPIGSLMVIAGRSDRTKFRNQVLQPLLDASLIEMTLPDKPTSRLQKYRLTEAGKYWVADHSTS